MRGSRWISCETRGRSRPVGAPVGGPEGAEAVFWYSAAFLASAGGLQCSSSSGAGAGGSRSGGRCSGSSNSPTAVSNGGRESPTSLDRSGAATTRRSRRRCRRLRGDGGSGTRPIVQECATERRWAPSQFLKRDLPWVNNFHPTSSVRWRGLGGTSGGIPLWTRDAPGGRPEATHTGDDKICGRRRSRLSAKVVRHGRHITCQMTETAIVKTFFAKILPLIGGL